jgi:uncharacterized repeat protein (TIGR03803 family)
MTFKNASRIFCAVIGLALTFSLAVRAQAQTESVIYSFPGNYGGFYASGTLIRDSAGNLYGTTEQGGNCCGTVFRLSPAAGGGWTHTVLRGFSSGTLGAYVSPGVVRDAAGNLYGTTLNGGDLSVSCQGAGCGVVFELSPTSTGQWTETVLHKFTGGADGGVPNGALTLDAAGNVYGTAAIGGNLSACTSGFGNGCGVVYKLSHTSTGWRESVLRAFSKGPGGIYPNGGLALDAAGNVYGTTSEASNGLGGVFQLTPTSSGQWNENVLLNFLSEGNAAAGVIFDATGNLYGSTQSFSGECPESGTCGTVYELSPASGGSWTETILHTFTGAEHSDGAYPHDLTLDAAGNIYGATNWGGLFSQTVCSFGGCGSVFKLSPGTGGSWTETVLYGFTGGADGSHPVSGVAVDGSGNVFGEAAQGGTVTSQCGDGCGVVFEVTP